MDILDLIKRRRSMPKFLPDPVPRETIHRMLDAATWAPNHHLTEPWEFIVLEETSRDRFAADDFAATFCAVQNMLSVAAADGVGTYPRTGGLIHDRALRAFLSLTPDQDIATIIYVGYPAIVPERSRTPHAQKTRWMADATAPAALASSMSPPSEGRELPGGSDVAIDPVCHIEVDTATAQHTSGYRGQTYYFCASGCKMAFDAAPATYVPTP